MKNLKTKIGAALVGIGLFTGGYFIGHNNPKYVTIDKSFIEEFEELNPGYLNKKATIIKDENELVKGLILDKEKNIKLHFIGDWTYTKPNQIDLSEIQITSPVEDDPDYKGCSQILSIYYVPGKQPKDYIEFWKQAKHLKLKKLTLKEKILWEKLYEELAK